MIKLPFPPSLNAYYRSIIRRRKDGKHYTQVLISAKGRAYRTLVGQMLMIQGVREMTGDLEIEIKVFQPDRRKRDIDNLLKSLLDALQHGGAFVDDSQIKKLTIEMMEVRKPGHVEIEIKKRSE